MADTTAAEADRISDEFIATLNEAADRAAGKAEPKNRPPQPMTLAEFRATHAAGGFVRAELIGLGPIFVLMAHSRSGDRIVLVRNSDRTPREFSEASTAMRVIREAGFAQLGVSLERWEPAQLALGRQAPNDSRRCANG